MHCPVSGTLPSIDCDVDVALGNRSRTSNTHWGPDVIVLIEIEGLYVRIYSIYRHHIRSMMSGPIDYHWLNKLYSRQCSL